MCVSFNTFDTLDTDTISYRSTYKKDYLEVECKCPEDHIIFITELHKCFVAAHFYYKYNKARVSFRISGPWKILQHFISWTEGIGHICNKIIGYMVHTSHYTSTCTREQCVSY